MGDVTHDEGGGCFVIGYQIRGTVDMKSCVKSGGDGKNSDGAP